MAHVSIAILGLGRTGASVGLALKRYNQKSSEHNFTITGYDTNSSSVKAARKLDAIDDVSNRVDDAVRGKDIVVIAMPYAEVQAVYDIISHGLRPGAVIIDMAALKEPSLEWTDKNLPDEVHVVCATAIVNPDYLFDGTDETTRATEDYFDGGMLMLMPSVNCVSEAVSLSTDFARILGARSHFIDPAEHDALAAATQALPSLLGVAFFHTLSQGQGWIDMQRMTNPDFGMLTHHLFDTHPDDLRDLWLHSRSNLVRQLDEFMATLRSLRDTLVHEDRDAIESVLEQSSQEYEAWINRRHGNRWQGDERTQADAPSFGNVVGNMFGSFISDRFSGDKDDDKS